MSMKENAQTIAENMPKVYEAGKTSQWHTLWDSLQNKGARVAYGNFFQDWNENAFYPKYDLIVGGASMASENRSLGMFRTFNNKGTAFDLTARLEECGVTLDTSTCLDFMYFFLNAKVSRIPTIDVRAATKALYMTFYGCPPLVTIDKIVSAETTIWASNTFQGSTKLENLTIDGVIGTNGFNVSYCTLLSHDSLISILNALADYSTDTSGTTWVVTLGAENLNKLTDEEKAIATQKGWSIA